MESTDHDQFLRFRLVAEVERAEDMINAYWRGITEYHKRIKIHTMRLGRISQRLGEAEPKDDTRW